MSKEKFTEETHVISPEGLPVHEKFIVESREVVRLPDGRVVKRTTYTNGAKNDQLVFPADFPDAKPVKA